MGALHVTVEHIAGNAARQFHCPQR